MMFRELIDRSGLPLSPRTAVQRALDRVTVRSGARFPELFFLAVLAGEIFVDHDNQRHLRRPDLHPLFRRILQIHVIEEARHKRFAELVLEELLPSLASARRAMLRWVVPHMLRSAQRELLMPSSTMVRRYAIPQQTLRDAFGPGSAHRASVEAVATQVFVLFGEEGETLRVWRNVA